MAFTRGVLVLALLLSARAVPAAEPGEPADVKAIFATMRANLARIASIECTSGYSQKLYLHGVLQRSFEKETTFAYSSGKYRCRYLMKASDFAEHWRETAYDGLRYQEFFGDREVLQRSSKTPHSAYGGSQLFFYPYAGVVRPSKPFTVECFLDEAAWTSAAADAVVEGREVVDGHPCQVIRIKSAAPDKEQERRVHLAADLEYLPIRLEFQNEVSRTIFRVTQSESFQTPAGRIVIAMSAESETTHERVLKSNTTLHDRQVGQMWTNADGLKINHSIPPERFIIPPEQAKRVEDYD